ncbi:MAG: R3H domain-containing nucleic acid-binding protein [bacterium]|nr:R3H domain-containing nucleic acid-binding protein [bacterium]
METNNIIKKLIEFMAFEEAEVKCDEETRKISIFINDPVTPFLKKNLGQYVQDFSLLTHLIAKKLNEPLFFIDINNYRVERERIIHEFAKAAAKKVMATKEPIPLPPMNAYERRLVHTTLAVHPEVKTESVGEGRERHIVIALV